LVVRALKILEGETPMAALGSDFTDLAVLIYDANGNHLVDTAVISHDRGIQQIQVAVMPEELKANDDCKLLILSSPIPCEYRGKVKKSGGSLFIAMFFGQEKESRGSTRYKVSTPALIDALIVDGQPYPLQNLVKVVLINVSTNGVRFRAPYYSFEIGDQFQMHFAVSNSTKKLTAVVVNNIDNGTTSSDYGCRFVTT